MSSVARPTRAALEAAVGRRVPDLIAPDSTVPDENVRKFLQGYIDNFAKFAGRLAS